jgi:hypothetical protein
MKDEFLSLGNTLASIACCKFLVRQSIARSIDSLLLVGSAGVLGKLVRIVLYLVQFMKRFEAGGDYEIIVHNVSRRIGLWSEDSSFRLSIWVA